MHIFIKMRKEIFQEIEIPEGVEVDIGGTTLFVKGPEGENKKTFEMNKFNFEKKENKIIIGSKSATKREKKMINTISSHIRNMIKGVGKKFEYKLKICSTHFPISVEVKDAKVLIKNFLGEKIPRESNILKGVEVNIEGGIITVSSHDKELAGQTAANLEIATKIKKRDLRIFQDGIYIISRAGKEV